jgi:hypothetical protein
MGRRRRVEGYLDLEPYTGCPEDDRFDLGPLAVGWLERNEPFDTGKAPADFLAKLAEFCRPEVTVCQTAGARPCPLCRQQVPGLGRGEVRAIGDEDIYAAPDLIHHYVAIHNYRPPPEFIQAVMRGPGPDSVEHRALRKAY